tara:strand:- start:30563 stop:31861 length:1299 start_codon:yes stop_codon:yes gene_type:complete
MSSRKVLVVDTSVLLYDMTAIHSFPGNDVVLPLPVLDELDKFKNKPGLLGESARYVNRYLDSLRDIGRLDKAVTIPESDQTIRIETKYSRNNIPDGLDIELADNQILGSALKLALEFKNTPVKVVTKDINLRVKCDALGLIGEDYWKDHLELSADTAYSGKIQLELSDSDVDLFFEHGKIQYNGDEKVFENQFIIGKSPLGKSLLGIYENGYIKKNRLASFNSDLGIEPKNKEQAFAVGLLNNPNIQLVTITGIAGSGKTFITLMSALSGLFKKKYKRIVVTRSIEPVGRDLGYLPGDVDEKMAPWMAPLIDNFRHAFNDISYFESMRQKGEIEISPLSYIRGRTFNDSFVIVDEAQNATIHELKTIITRIGKGSKIVLLGDTDQVDTPYIDKRSNGLTIVVQKFKESMLTGHVHLINGHRSEIASLATSIL